MGRYTKVWRESTSIIPLIRRTPTQNLQKVTTFNYDILVQQRSSKAKFMPNSIVFPGGIIESRDSSLEWINHLKSFNISNSKFDVFRNLKGWDTPIFQSDNLDENRHISLRICAIRETFEELGILVCSRDGKEANQTPWAPTITDFNVKEWQKKVHDDPQEFLNLCQYLKCYPNIWSLYYWSEWLSPLNLFTARYDTAFFMVFFESLPAVLHEASEVSDVMLSPPDSLISNYYNEEIYLPPPQLYELLRLKNKNTIEDFVHFSIDRNPQVPELLYPITEMVKDGMLALLPGDDLYPKEPNLVENTVWPEEIQNKFRTKTLAELKDETEVLHRVEHSKRSLVHTKNYVPKGNHFVPSNFIQTD